MTTTATQTRTDRRLALVEHVLLAAGVNASEWEIERLVERFRAKPFKKLKRSVLRTLAKSNGEL